MHNIDLILTLVGGFSAALVLGFITHKLGLSPIVGYLIAGIAVGPQTPGFVANREMADQLAEIGVVLLMFGVGLQFHFKELLAVRRIAIPGAIVQSAVATGLGALVAHAFGWSWAAGFIFGLAIAVASTVVLTRVLVDNNELHTPTGHIAIGWLVMEDLFTVFALVMLPAIFGENAQQNLVMSFAVAGIKIVALVLVTIVGGGFIIPRFLTYIAHTGSRELFTLAILATALGIAVSSTLLFGVSMALGAFLAGMVVGRSDFSLRAANEALPMRDAFAVLFFVSVGMLFNFNSLLDNPLLVIVTVAIIVVGKPLAAFLIIVAMKYPVRVALAVSAALAQIGEFSFILAVLGEKLKILPPQAANILMAAAIITITMNPLIFRSAAPLEKWLRRFAIFRSILRFAEPADMQSALETGVDPDKREAIVIGYGPVGRTVARLLAANGFTPMVIDLNLKTARELKKRNLPVVYGDASHAEILKKAGGETADILILSSSSITGGKEIIREAKAMNPKIRILARTAYLREIHDLRAAGADAVFAGEGEVALSITEYIMAAFGATPEQIERERERVHTKLFGAGEET
ncbi:cation:proton antiporter [Turneriella parva]|uniref:Kef-type potassium/proton antiporter, CPA2 family n=1 Tax=Turneriella parva (strain ATCC BAA-1111 / DSM 21527 / NCTC 11395 / H) TaxID=869212 RepID=I4B3N5_TURPD|nr:cation:proton antiporter [Turneriella parva]AFM11892.1 Kef-type potassium/proton antiporter, CPA2 family [Turneriella parva DSM 21527]